MISTVHNFNPGPSALPHEVLVAAQRDLINFEESGIGILEVSHRSEAFERCLEKLKEGIKSLVNLPSGYKILFCTGGATQQFSMVPMNLLREGCSGNYLISGIWAEKALDEAKKFGSALAIASSKESGYKSLPSLSKPSPDAAYLHFTSNNTVEGTQYKTEPEASGIPLICDASSDIFSRVIPIEKYGLLYAGAQKNLGAAGVTLVIIRDDLIASQSQTLPLLLQYATYSAHNSLYNTPPVFAIYLMEKVIEWIHGQGGLSVIEEKNKAKASLLYNFLDESTLFIPHAEKEARSAMNVTFFLRDNSHFQRILQEAKEARIVGLQGHKTFGGFRASLYNAVSIDSVEYLVSFLRHYEERCR